GQVGAALHPRQQCRYDTRFSMCRSFIERCGARTPSFSHLGGAPRRQVPPAVPVVLSSLACLPSSDYPYTHEPETRVPLSVLPDARPSRRPGTDVRVRALCLQLGAAPARRCLLRARETHWLSPSLGGPHRAEATARDGLAA